MWISERPLVLFAIESNLSCFATSHQCSHLLVIIRERKSWGL